MEMEMEDLPSYKDVVKVDIHYFDDSYMWNVLNFILICDINKKTSGYEIIIILIIIILTVDKNSINIFWLEKNLLRTTEEV